MCLDWNNNSHNSVKCLIISLTAYPKSLVHKNTKEIIYQGVIIYSMKAFTGWKS